MKTEENWICSLNPITKLGCITALIIMAFLVPPIYGYGIFGLFLLIAIISGTVKKFLYLFFRSLFVLSIFIFLMRGAFAGGEQIIASFWILDFTREGFEQAFSMTAKILAIGGGLMLFFQITNMQKFMIALEKRGVSPRTTYVILASIQTIPEMGERAKTIMDAQKTRGVETEGNVIIRAKAFLPTLGPLVLSSIAGTEEKAITLESRAFTAPRKKTRILEVEDRKSDRILRIAAVVLLAVTVLGRIFIWQ